MDKKQKKEREQVNVKAKAKKESKKEPAKPTKVSWFKKRTWHDYVFVVFLVFILVVSINLVLDMKTLASPLHGGDHYFQLGSINHMIHGGNPFAGSNVLGTLPGYLPFYGMLVAYPAKLFGLDGMAAMRLFSVIFTVISVCLMYRLFTQMSKHKTTVLFVFLGFATLNFFPIFKYTPFTEAIMFPLFYLAALFFIQKQNYKTAIAWGVILGLIGISHAVAFISAMIFFGLFALYYLWIEPVGFFGHKKPAQGRIDSKKWKKRLLLILIIFVIGFVLAMPYWFKPIFISHGQTSQNYTGWNSIDFSQLQNKLGFAKEELGRTFFQFAGIKYIHHLLFSLAALIGLIFLFIRWWQQRKEKQLYKTKEDVFTLFTKILFIASIIGGFHYFITQPLLGMDFVPEYINRFLLNFLKPVLVLFFVKEMIPILKTASKHNKKVIASFFIICFLVAAGMQVHAYRDFGSSHWYDRAKNDVFPEHKGIIEFLDKYSDVNDVILSTPELGFTLNGLTGRKLVVTRRAQNDAFYDFDPHFRDTALILYSSNDDVGKRKKLIKDYDIKYLYWEIGWIRTEYEFKEDTDEVGIVDPIAVFDTPENRAYFDRYGVTYLPQHTWLDPALKGDQYKKLNLLYVTPSYRSLFLPWDKSLDPYLKHVWNYQENGMPIAILYKVDVDNPRPGNNPPININPRQSQSSASRPRPVSLQKGATT